MPGTDIQEKKQVVVNYDIKEPPLYKIIYLNDDVTTVEFVVTTLCEILDYNEMGASEKAREIHENGSAVVAEYPYEIAEQKGTEVVLLARKNGFPLNLKLEPVE